MDFQSAFCGSFVTFVILTPASLYGPAAKQYQSQKKEIRELKADETALEQYNKLFRKEGEPPLTLEQYRKRKQKPKLKGR